ncbi:MAG: ATP-binding protein [Aulosira sp. ZfuVER01]|nr:ATP-binding protein [Aulosira sp. ZfuVER01]MDZ7997712.1 ATP-binding protein [Aulosira sp. DedVER01a]MDZ8052207.1 ATP-binding protein [Aulosira sp. ZfuCHP01]
MEKSGFPKHLLEQPVKERTEYFTNYTMAHPHLVKAFQTLMRAIYKAPGTSLIFVVGATGVGKTTLLRRLVQKLNEAALPQLEIHKGKIPVFGVEAKSPEFSQFDWKDFYIRLLKAVNEPLIDKKITYEDEKVNERDSKAKWRRAVESALINRNPDAFYIDEAHHLALLSSGQKLKDQPEVLKSLANLANTKIILTGTYDLLPLIDLGDQLCRRTKTVHFQRYHPEYSIDEKSFKNLLKTFEQQLPLSNTPDLEKHWEFLYERSIGCVGMLKDWLSETLEYVLEQDEHARTITLKDLQLHARPVSQCLKIIKAVKVGEQKLQDSEQEIDELRRELRLIQNREETNLNKEFNNQNNQVEKTNKTIGKPKPIRYKVGQD